MPITRPWVTRELAPKSAPHCRRHGSLCPSIDARHAGLWEGLRAMGTIGDRDGPCDLISRVVPAVEQLGEVALLGEKTGQRFRGKVTCGGVPAHERDRDLPDPAGPEFFGWRLEVEGGMYHVRYKGGRFFVADRFGFVPHAVPEIVQDILDRRAERQESQ